MRERDLWIATLAATLVVSAVFAAWPALDVAIAGLFWDPEAGFALAGSPGLLFLRELAWNSALGLAVFSLIMLAGTLWLGSLARTSWRVWTYVLALAALGPGLLVNALLKSHVGRARPAHLEEFGGSATFTPPYQVTDQCATNCSFVSGEAAGVAAAAFAVLAVLWHGRGAVFRGVLVLLAAVYVIGPSLMRVMMGRHFASDVLLAVLFVALVALVLYPALGIAQARQGFGAGAVTSDLRALARRLGRGAQGIRQRLRRGG